MNAPSIIAQQKYLSKPHEKHIAERGLLNDWARASCQTVTAEEASSPQSLGYTCQSGGILFKDAGGQIQFKPDKPWKFHSEKKAPKYRSPLGDFDAFLPLSPDNPLYWEIESLKREAFYINEHPYILITEGVFKAIAGCANGLPTVSLLGVEQGLTGKKGDAEGKRYLVPALRKLAEMGFGFIIAFDADANKNKNIHLAAKNLTVQLAKFKVPIRNITGCWDMGLNGELKGMDDFIQHKGIEAFRAILTKSKLPGEKSAGEGGEDEEKEESLPEASVTANIIAEDYRDKLAWESEYQMWRHYGAEHDGCWDITTEESVRELIHCHIEALEFGYSSGYVSSVLKILKSKLEARKWNEEPGLIPLRDGVLDQKTLKLSEHAPGYRLTWQLPFGWEERAIGCAPIEEFLLNIAGHRDIAEVLLAYLAAIVTGRADLQRYLELIGGGGTGKSTYMALAKALIGDDNAVSSQLKLLESNQFETARFYQKKLTLFPDSERWQGEVSVLKQLTGQDPIRYERKGVQQCRDFIYGGMVILSANEAPQSSDRTSGQERRKLTIGLDTRCPEYEGRELTKEFAPYLPGLLARILAMSPERVTELVKYSDRSVPALAEKKWSQLCETNPIAEWLDDRVVAGAEFKTYMGTNNPDTVGKWLYANFCQFQAESGYKQSISNKRFSNNLKDLLKNQLKLSIKEGRDRDGSYIEGIGLRCLVDPSNSLPRPVTKKSFDCDGFVTGCDGSVTAETLTDVGCDGCDGFLENPEKLEKISPIPPILPIPAPKLKTISLSESETVAEFEKNPSHPSHPTLASIPAITSPSQTHHKPITSPEPQPEPIAPEPEPIESKLDRALVQIRAASNWAEAKAVWGGDEELLDLIRRASFTKDKEEWLRISKLKSEAICAPGTKVLYIGKKPHLIEKYGGIELTVDSIDLIQERVKDIHCQMPDGSLSSPFSLIYLDVVGQQADSIAPQKIKVGDRVKIAEDYGGHETLKGVEATVKKYLGEKWGFDIEFDTEVEIVGGKPKKFLTVSAEFLAIVTSAEGLAP